MLVVMVISLLAPVMDSAEIENLFRYVWCDPH